MNTRDFFLVVLLVAVFGIASCLVTFHSARADTHTVTDTASLITAIGAVEDGDMIYMQNANYTLATQPEFVKNITVSGASEAGVIVYHTAFELYVNQYSSIDFNNITIIGNGRDGIMVNGSANFTNCNIAASNHGIFANSFHGNVSSCVITSGNKGVSSNADIFSNFSFCNISGDGTGGIYSGTSINGNFSNCNISGHAAISTTTLWANFTSCIVTGNDVAVYASTMHSNFISCNLTEVSGTDLYTNFTSCNITAVWDGVHAATTLWANFSSCHIVGGNTIVSATTLHTKFTNCTMSLVTTTGTKYGVQGAGDINAINSTIQLNATTASVVGISVVTITTDNVTISTNSTTTGTKTGISGTTVTCNNTHIYLNSTSGACRGISASGNIAFNNGTVSIVSESTAIGLESGGTSVILAHDTMNGTIQVPANCNFYMSNSTLSGRITDPATVYVVLKDVSIDNENPDYAAVTIDEGSKLSVDNCSIVSAQIGIKFNGSNVAYINNTSITSTAQSLYSSLIALNIYNLSCGDIRIGSGTTNVVGSTMGDCDLRSGTATFTDSNIGNVSTTNMVTILYPTLFGNLTIDDAGVIVYYKDIDIVVGYPGAVVNVSTAHPVATTVGEDGIAHVTAVTTALGTTVEQVYSMSLPSDWNLTTVSVHDDDSDTTPAVFDSIEWIDVAANTTITWSYASSDISVLPDVTNVLCYGDSVPTTAAAFLDAYPSVAWVGVYDESTSKFVYYYQSGFGTNFDILYSASLLFGATSETTYVMGNTTDSSTYTAPYGSSFRGNPTNGSVSLSQFFNSSKVVWIGIKVDAHYVYYYSWSAGLNTTMVDPFEAIYIGASAETTIHLTI